MKPIFVLLVVFTSAVTLHGQQILSNDYYGKKSPTQTKEVKIHSLDGSQKDSIIETPIDTINFRVFGVGNISNEALEAVNAGGKIVFGFCPNPFTKKWQGNFFASFNKNATNTDSALASTLIFPEAGNHSFLVHSFWKSSINESFAYQGPFLEFAVKKITNKKDTTDPKFKEFSFNTLHYTLGYKLGFSKEKIKDDKRQHIGCELAVFYSYVNIPDEDHENFEKIINRTATKNDFGMLGFKVSFEVNGLQIFGDIRNVFGSKEELPVNDLKGFSYNIGFSFNTEVFRF